MKVKEVNMKKIFKGLIIIGIFLLSGCGIKNADSVLKVIMLVVIIWKVLWRLLIMRILILIMLKYLIKRMTIIK